VDISQVVRLTLCISLRSNSTHPQATSTTFTYRYATCTAICILYPTEMLCRTFEITRTTDEHPNGPSSTVLLIPLPWNAELGEHNGLPVSMTGYHVLPSNTNHTKKVRMLALASICPLRTTAMQHQMEEIRSYGKKTTNSFTDRMEIVEVSLGLRPRDPMDDGNISLVLSQV
jgi:hypothetical protein